ncbi:protein NEDD1-like [Actinia tenebrosa]|uniref:Protein NEDD1-like n=1 Tax=Actinia tenebrosa TaxID=6105 RepID=A0A6P8I1U2_ACTTE|nr:protein NEDD1-like [Actinia tenebrosa]
MDEKARLASAGSEIKLWEMPGLVMTNSMSLHSQPVSSLCWGNNNQTLVSVGGDKVVVTYLKNGAISSTEMAVGDGYSCAAFNSTSRYLLLGGKTKTLSVWDLKSKSVKKTYKEHKDAVSCLTFNHNDTTIASGALDGNILLHNVVTGQASSPLRQPNTQAIRGLQYSYFKKSLLASVSDDGALNMWDTNARKMVTSFTNDHKAPATGLCFSPVNEMLLVSTGLDKKIVFYDVQGKKSVKVMTAEAPLTSVDFLHDGVTLAVGTTRGKICVYDLRSGSTPVAVQPAHMSSVQCLKFESSSTSSSKNAPGSINKVTKSVTSVNIRPRTTSRNLPEQPHPSTPKNYPASPATTNSTTPQFNDPTPKLSVQQQNGIKEDEDIFSPLREAKVPMVINNRRDEERPIPPPYGFDQEGLVKDNKHFDGSGIFSPLASTNNQSDTRQHPVGGPAYYHPDQGTPRTTAEPTSYGSRSQNALYSNTRNTEEQKPLQPDYDRKKKYEDLREIRAQISPDATDSVSRPESDYYDTRTRIPSDSSASGARNPFETSPTLSRHSSNSSDIYSRPEADFVRARQDRRSAGSESSYQGDANHSAAAANGSARLSRSPGGSSYQPRRTSSDSIGDRKDGLDGPGIVKKSNEMPYTNGDVAGAVANNAGLQPFQIEFIKNMIDDSMDEFRVAIHRDVVNLQVEMLRQFQIQQNELREMMEKYSINEALVQEIDRLREENRRLKTKY